MMKESSDYVLIGEIGKPHGIKGELKITPYSGDSARLASYEMLFLSSDQKGLAMQGYTLLKGRDQEGYAVISLAGVDDRNAAEQLRDCSVWVRRDELPELAENEFYWHDYQGRDVFTREGDYLGRVKKLVSNGPHDLLVIGGKQGREYMIPVCDDFVAGPDAETGGIVVSPPEGLLDINE